MFDEVLKERRNLLDLVLLISMLTFLLSIGAVYLAKMALIWQGTVILIALVAIGWRVLKSPIFEREKQRRLHLALGYDTETTSFLCGPGLEAPTHINRAAHLLRVSGEPDIDTRLSGGDPGEATEPILDMFEYSLFRLLGDRYRKSWEILREVEVLGGRETHAGDDPGDRLEVRDVLSLFSSNRVFAILREAIGGEDTEERAGQPEAHDAPAIREVSRLAVHIPSGTSLEVEDLDGSSGRAFRLKVGPISVRFWYWISRTGHGHPAIVAQGAQNPLQLLSQARQEGPEAMLAQQRRFRNWVIETEAEIGLSRLWWLHPRAGQLLGWVEDMLDWLDRGFTYPLHQAQAVRIGD